MWLLAFAMAWADEHRDRSGTARAYWRLVGSKTHSRIERFWGFVNPHIILPMKLVLLNMQRAQHLDLSNPLHIGACQGVVTPLLQYACDVNLTLWNMHPVRARGGGAVLGAPNDLMRCLPTVADRVPCPAGVPARYTAASQGRSGSGLPDAPVWAAAREPLLGQPDEQQRRAEHVAVVLGPLEDAWSDVLHTGGERFQRAFAVWLSYD